MISYCRAQAVKMFNRKIYGAAQRLSYDVGAKFDL